MNNKPIMTMVIGIPGGGKSQMALDLSKELNAKIYASDTLREELYGNAAIQGDNKVLFKELEDRIRESLKKGENCIYDATNINGKKRKLFLNSLKKIKCVKECVFMATDLNVCLQRNNVRERKVPYEVIKRMYMHIDIPQYREGWDKISIHQTRDSLREYDIEKDIEKLKKIPHDNPHHKSTIGEHIEKVANQIFENSDMKDFESFDKFDKLYTAAMFHDIGKKVTKTFINSKGEETKIAHYYNHERVSAYEFLLYCTEEDLTDRLEDMLYIADLIALHMKLFVPENQFSKMIHNLEKQIGTKKLEDLKILHLADIYNS